MVEPAGAPAGKVYPTPGTWAGRDLSRRISVQAAEMTTRKSRELGRMSAPLLALPRKSPATP